MNYIPEDDTMIYKAVNSEIQVAQSFKEQIKTVHLMFEITL